ncbi:hypothetical protein BD770DRAFT_407178 [Pilaira anomala]|nr:hypothetical protein BD770DRAFT_407178 [Pilaira anomala]
MSHHSDESSPKEDRTPSPVNLTKEQVKKLEEEIELLANENQNLDDEIDSAQGQLKKLESTGPIAEEQELQLKLTHLTEEVESLMEATEALEEADLLEADKVNSFTLEAEQKLDKEIESLQAEIKETQQKLAQLQKKH